MSSDLQTITLKALLESSPPGVIFHVRCEQRSALNLIPIEAYCDEPRCEKTMIFDSVPSYREQLSTEDLTDAILTYRCRHCATRMRWFALLFGSTFVDANEMTWIRAMKFGEHPPPGPLLSKGLLRLAKGDRSLWLSGRRCENLGLGIAAYAYYRRVIERQKTQLFDRLIEVCKAVEPRSPLIGELERAKGETQFTKAIESIHTAVPQAMLFQGHNPLRLLHSALSDGLHSRTDAECLALAKSIRTLMSRTVELMDSVLAEDAEVAEALKQLVNAKQGRSAQSTDPDDSKRDG